MEGRQLCCLRAGGRGPSSPSSCLPVVSSCAAPSLVPLLRHMWWLPLLPPVWLPPAACAGVFQPLFLLSCGHLCFAPTLPLFPPLCHMWWPLVTPSVWLPPAACAGAFQPLFLPSCGYLCFSASSVVPPLCHMYWLPLLPPCLSELSLRLRYQSALRSRCLLTHRDIAIGLTTC